MLTWQRESTTRRLWTSNLVRARLREPDRGEATLDGTAIAR